MEKFVYTELIVTLCSVLAVIWYNEMKQSSGPVLTAHKVFRVLIVANIGAMLFDLINSLMEGTHYPFSRLVMYASICLYYFSHSYTGYLYLLYVDLVLYQDIIRFKKRMPYYTIPFAVLLFMSVASIWTGWFYVIDENNVYQRGSVYLLLPLISFFYILYSAYVTINWAVRKQIETKKERELFTRLLFFPILPCVGAVIQILIPGSVCTFLGTVLALLTNYVSEQNGEMSRDHLTGLYNRNQLERFLNNQLKNLKQGNYFFLILLDLDKFKSINDTYGHVIGDDALIHAARMLRGKCKRKEDYVVRLGGDEFVIIGQCQNKDAPDMIVKRMYEATEEFNQKANKPYKLSFSAGYTIYDGTGTANLDKLINAADQEMYKVKRAKKMKESLENIS